MGVVVGVLAAALVCSVVLNVKLWHMASGLLDELERPILEDGFETELLIGEDREYCVKVWQN